jgi:hypothetical protein
MADFFRVSVTDDNFIRGAARLLVAGITVTFPTSPSDIINLSSYDAQTGWTDLGATKTGITYTRGGAEESFEVDQILDVLDTRPTEWTQTVATQLAEMTLERLQVAWEGGPISGTGSGFRRMGVGGPTTYTRRMLAVVFKKQNDKLRFQVFRKVQRAAQDSAVVYNKTGEQQSAPLTFTALADTSIADVNDRVQVIWDQE